MHKGSVFVLDSKLSWLWQGMPLLAVIFLQACSMIAGSPTPPPRTLGKLEEIVQRGILVIATDPAYPPQSEFVKEAARLPNTRCDLTAWTANQLRGFDIDVAVEIARRMGVEACFVAPAWSQIVSGGWNDLWDISVGSMVITQERMQNLYFTQPYVSGDAVLFVNKDDQTYHTPDELSGKRIGVCTGCAYEKYLEGALVIPGQKLDFTIKNAIIVGYDTDTSALADLAQGPGLRLDAVLSDSDTGQHAIDSGLAIKQLGGPLYHDYVAAAIDKRSGKDPVPFAREVTRIIQEMHQDGTLSQLSRQYYGSDYASVAGQFDVQALNQFSTVR